MAAVAEVLGIVRACIAPSAWIICLEKKTGALRKAASSPWEWGSEVLLGRMSPQAPASVVLLDYPEVCLSVSVPLCVYVCAVHLCAGCFISESPTESEWGLVYAASGPCKFSSSIQWWSVTQSPSVKGAQLWAQPSLMYCASGGLVVLSWTSPPEQTECEQLTSISKFVAGLLCPPPPSVLSEEEASDRVP